MNLQEQTVMAGTQKKPDMYIYIGWYQIVTS